MRTLFISLVLLLCLNTVVSAELSVGDLEKIREIVKESEVRLEKSIAETEKRLEKRITETEQRLEKHFTDRFTDQGKRLDFQGTLVITLIGAVIAFVGIPLTIIAYQQNKRTQQDDNNNTIKAQATEIQALREKIEALEKSLN